ncbi:MAG: acyltransferase, partial [Myxococcota bacterium]|nr:acyltransferase [Myxococcota bacterium]
MNDPRKPIVGGQDPRRIFPYEPALDGLRAIALIGISGYHANIPWLNGGFLGVDLFFVLSGYLITRLMLAEWQGTHRIELVAFWERRIRRLFPGMLFLLAGVVGYAWWLANPALLARMRGDLLST